MSAVKHRKREQVDDGEIDAEVAQEGKGLEKSGLYLHPEDHEKRDGPAHAFGRTLGLALDTRGEECPQNAEDALGVI